jgi:hypothetical protein
MAIALFINEQYIKDNTPLPYNLDAKFIAPNVVFAQDTYIQNMLGSALYNTLQLHYSAQTCNSYETELVNLIQPALAYRASEAALPFIHVQLRNSGTVKLNADNQTVQSSQAEMEYLKDILCGRAEFYEKQVVNYLIFSGMNFPDYIQPDVTGILPSQKSTTTCDLYFRSWGANSSMLGKIAFCGCGNPYCMGGCGFYN